MSSSSRNPSPAPPQGGNGPPHNLKPINTRASLQPQPIARSGAQPNPLPARPLGIIGASARPTSELLNAGSNVAFQTPEVDAIDQWFENLQSYESMLEEMAAASLDANFKEELSAIEQWFRVLSEAERTAALYSLLQNSTQMQIRFFITVLQQMARSDPMTALLSPSAGASMQSQMEARLASMGLKTPSAAPVSPAARAFPNRQSFAGDISSNYLSPESAHAGSGDAATTLAQQRAKLNANAAHRISAPGPLTQEGGGGPGTRTSSIWPSSQLGQVLERSPSPNPKRESTLSPPLPSSARPQSTDFSSTNVSFRPSRAGQDVERPSSLHPLEEQMSPLGAGGNWASMVNTPAVPMFAQDALSTNPSLESATNKLATWNQANGRSVVLDDARKFRRVPSRGDMAGQRTNEETTSSQFVQNTRSGNQGNNGLLSPQNLGWPAPRSPGSQYASLADIGSDAANVNFQMAQQLGSPAHAQAAMAQAMAQLSLGMSPNPAFYGGMPAVSPLNMGVNPMQAQLLAAQLAASGYNPAAFGMGGLQSQQPGGRANAANARGGGPRSASTGRGNASSKPAAGDAKKEEEVDPKMLEDVPAWLRHLRLHKYTPNFEDSNWREMVMMDEAALEAKGVAALGARRKLLKTFEVVRAKMGIETPAHLANADAGSEGAPEATADGANEAGETNV